MLIYYSLGNFQSLQRKEATLLGVTVKGNNWQKDFKGARIVDFNMETLVTDYRLGGGVVGILISLQLIRGVNIPEQLQNQEISAMAMRILT